jgi:hypothetical protein
LKGYNIKAIGFKNKSVPNLPMRVRTITIVFFGMIFLCGCVASSQVYSGSRKNKDEIAILIIPSHLRFVTVDGKKIDYVVVHNRVELLPGKHTIVVTYLQQGQWASDEPFEPIALDFEVEAGHRYLVKNEIRNDGWKTWIEDMTGRKLTFYEVFFEGF